MYLTRSFEWFEYYTIKASKLIINIRPSPKPDICIIRDIEHGLPKSANEGTTDLLSQELINYLGVDINIERLKVQLAMLPDVIKTAFDGSIKKVTNIRTIADAMTKSTIYQSMLCEVDKLLLLYLTIPVTTATAERSYSSLRRVKTSAKHNECLQTEQLAINACASEQN